jgi:glutamyl-tRNA reductase
VALIAVGANFRTAPLEVREKFVYPSAEVLPVLSRIRAAGATEAALLSTCNRTEFYLVESDGTAVQAIWKELSERLGDDAQRFGYVRRDREVAAHLFRVASGLDSMILGEAQIQGQVRDAWEASRSQSGAALNRLFQSALAVASRVRTETAVARGAASVSSAAVQLAKQIFGSLRGRRAMVLGAGEMAELALQCLKAEGVSAAIVANRTYERASELAALHSATALHYDACWSALAEVDVVITSTAAPHVVVRTEHIAPTLPARGDRPLCILDIALPRDVDPDVRTLGNVFLYDLDDLRSVVAATLGRRQDELPSAEALLSGEVERYWAWLAGLASVPVLTTLRSEMDRVRERELAEALRRLSHLSSADRETVEYLSHALMNKFLHSPSVRLRAAAANGRGLGVVDAARYLFALDESAGEASANVSGDSPAPTDEGHK